MLYDLAIKNGCIVDGTGSPPSKANLCILDGRIALLNRSNTGFQAEKIIDASGLIVTPGFIDSHTHSDITLLVNNRAESSIRQGVTTEVVGNCGISAAPVNTKNRRLWKQTLLGFTEGLVKTDWTTFKEYFDRLEKNGIAQNISSFAGHTSLRIASMGFKPKPANKSELEEMKETLAQALQEGALGLSSGLSYSPGQFADRKELLELCKVVGEFGGIYTTHIRHYDNRMEEAIKEAIDIGLRCKIPVQISHLTSHYPGRWKKEFLQMIDEGRLSGVDVACDIPPVGIASFLSEKEMRPYGMTFLYGVLPKWAIDRDVRRFLDKLENSEFQEEIKRFREPKISDLWWTRAYALKGWWDKIFLESSEKSPELVGKDIQFIARELKKEPYDAVFDILKKEGEGCMRTLVSGKTGREDNFRDVLLYRFSSVISDSITLAPYGRLSSMRLGLCPYGCFPMILRKYVLNEGLLSLERAIAKFTSIPANRMGFDERGLLKEGMAADIVIFSPERIEDRATFENPHQYSKGICFVIVNGEIVIDRGRHTGKLPGKILRKEIKYPKR